MNEKWLEVKEKVGFIEEVQKGLEGKFKTYAQVTQQEMDEYVSMGKQIESEYNAIKKKKINAIDDLKKVFFPLFKYQLFLIEETR